MPLPLVLGIAAAIAAAGGVGAGAHGAVKMKGANDTVKSAEARHKHNIGRFETCNTKTAQSMDALGHLELDILASFQEFSAIFEQIQNRPEFKEINCESVELPTYDKEQIKTVSVGAGVLMGGIGGAAMGTAGGFAAAGATTAAVMALGTASTGTAIATLSGAAATNATLAALGGGALAAGGGGIALGTTMLGATTLGVGLLVGGIIFSITGSTLSHKAEQAWEEMLKAEEEINKICLYLNQLDRTAVRYMATLDIVNKTYRRHLYALDAIVNINKKYDWNDFTQQERLVTMNTVLFVQLLYKMCQVKVVLASDEADGLNTVNAEGVHANIATANAFLTERGFDEQNTSSEWSFTEAESQCLAIAASLYYFAKCDGNISEQESEMVMSFIQPMIDAATISDEAMAEIQRIREGDALTFDQIKCYLDHTTDDELKKFGAIIEKVIAASDGVTDAESAAKETFMQYVRSRIPEDEQPTDTAPATSFFGKVKKIAADATDAVVTTATDLAGKAKGVIDNAGKHIANKRKK